jgi:hypothetical protein
MKDVCNLKKSKIKKSMGLEFYWIINFLWNHPHSTKWILFFILELWNNILFNLYKLSNWSKEIKPNYLHNVILNKLKEF